MMSMDIIVIKLENCTFYYAMFWQLNLIVIVYVCMKEKKKERDLTYRI